MSERYLGDGVYASWDDMGQIRLRCAAPSEPDVVYLEGSVFVALYRFAQERWNKLPPLQL